MHAILDTGSHTCMDLHSSCESFVGLGHLLHHELWKDFNTNVLFQRFGDVEEDHSRTRAYLNTLRGLARLITLEGCHLATHPCL